MRRLAHNMPTIVQVTPTYWEARDDAGIAIGRIHVEDRIDAYGEPQRVVDTIHVVPAHRRRGIARSLWEAAGYPLHDSADMLTEDGTAFARGVGGPHIVNDPNT